MEDEGRREFIKMCLGAGAAGLLAWSGIGCSKSGKSGLFIPVGQDYIMNLADYPALNADGSVVAVEGTPLERRLLVTHIGGPEYHAFDSSCPHQGCIVNPAAGSMQCPCHGSVFNLLGGNVSGPAPRPLTSFTATYDGSTLKIHF
jgi:cytochrome b6-f complex iron-sulfur subunit